MWVVTVFNDINDIRIFEYTTKIEVTSKLEKYTNAILSYTK